MIDVTWMYLAPQNMALTTKQHAIDIITQLYKQLKPSSIKRYTHKGTQSTPTCNIQPPRSFYARMSQAIKGAQLRGHGSRQLVGVQVPVRTK